MTRNNVPGSMTRSLGAVVTVADEREKPRFVGLAAVPGAGIPDNANTTSPKDGTLEENLTHSSAARAMESLPPDGAVDTRAEFSLGGLNCSESRAAADVTPTVAMAAALISFGEALLLSFLAENIKCIVLKNRRMHSEIHWLYLTWLHLNVLNK